MSTHNERMLLDTHPAGILVEDARQAYEASVAHGGKGARAPVTLQDGAGGTAVMSEVELYGDVVLRYISGDWKVGHSVGHSVTSGQQHSKGRGGAGCWDGTKY
jgi:4-hydroxyphenylpyruvate dioxygenase